MPSNVISTKVIREAAFEFRNTTIQMEANFKATGDSCIDLNSLIIQYQLKFGIQDKKVLIEKIIDPYIKLGILGIDGDTLFFIKTGVLK